MAEARLINILDTLKQYVADGQGIAVGNRWFKVNLHVHGSGQDAEALVQSARDAAIDIIAVTDHQTFANVEPIMAAASTSGRKLTVLPGIEATANEGPHLLLVFPEDYGPEKRTAFLGWLEIAEEGDTSVAAKKGVGEILEKVCDEGGIVVTPHPWSKGIGLLDSSRKMSTRMAWLESSHVRLIQTMNEAHAKKVKYIGSDEDGNWVNRYVVASSKTKHIRDSTYCLAPINVSDAHTVAEIAEGCSWLRMSEPSVRGLKQVGFEPRTRIALTQPEEPEHPRVLAIHVSGGYCDGQVFRFNESLNCIIGENYAGKSAVFDFLQFALGQEQELPDQDRERLGVRLHGILQPGGAVEVYLTQGDRQFVVTREFDPDVTGEGTDVEVLSFGDGARSYEFNTQEDQLEPVDDVPFRLEVYQQGRIGRLRDDVGRQLEMIDGFADLGGLLNERDTILAKMKESAARLKPLLEEQERLAIQVATRPTLSKELREKEELLSDKEEVLWSRADQVVGELTDLTDTLTELRAEMSAEAPLLDAGDLQKLFGLRTPVPPSEPVAEEALVQSWVSDAERVIKEIGEAREALTAAVDAWFDASSGHQKKWKAKRTAREGVVRRNLAKAGVKSPKELTTRVAELRRLINEIDSKAKPRLDRVRKTVAEEQKSRRELRAKLATILKETTSRRTQVAAQLTKQLEERIRISIKPGANRDSYLETLHEICDDLTSRAQKIQNRDQQLSAVASSLGPLELADELQRARARGGENGVGALAARCGTTQNTVQVLTGILDDIELLDRLERIQVVDVPVIEVRRSGEDAYADLRTGLSQGEQSAALLSLALQTRDMPLVLDQPEDELGYKYVVHLVVPRILAAKPHRQLLLITHNANIPVLGDSDLVTKMENRPRPGEGRECRVALSGCFEDQGITGALLELEGGKQAFRFRQDRYGVPPLRN